jgi:Sodium/hydrogen exchanger family
MPTISFDGLLIVAAAALGAPLALGLFPRIRLPAIVLEIVLGIVIGPQVLGRVSIDTPIQVMSLLGLAFLLLLAGLEVEYERFRGALLRVTALGYTISFGLALLIGLGLHASGLVKSPLLLGIALSATSLGIVIPVLKDAGQVDTAFGQLVATSTIAADHRAPSATNRLYRGWRHSGGTTWLGPTPRQCTTTPRRSESSRTTAAVASSIVTSSRGGSSGRQAPKRSSSPPHQAKLGYCMRKREAFVRSDAYAPESPLSFS